MALEDVVNESADLQEEVIDTVTADGDVCSCDPDESQQIDSIGKIQAYGQLKLVIKNVFIWLKKNCFVNLEVE